MSIRETWANVYRFTEKSLFEKNKKKHLKMCSFKFTFIEMAEIHPITCT